MKKVKSKTSDDKRLDVLLSAAHAQDQVNSAFHADLRRIERKLDLVLKCMESLPVDDDDPVHDDEDEPRQWYIVRGREEGKRGEKFKPGVYLYFYGYDETQDRWLWGPDRDEAERFNGYSWAARNMPKEGPRGCAKSRWKSEVICITDVTEDEDDL